MSINPPTNEPKRSAARAFFARAMFESRSVGKMSSSAAGVVRVGLRHGHAVQRDQVSAPPRPRTTKRPSSRVTPTGAEPPTTRSRPSSARTAPRRSRLAPSSTPGAPRSASRRCPGSRALRHHRDHELIVAEPHVREVGDLAGLNQHSRRRRRSTLRGPCGWCTRPARDRRRRPRPARWSAPEAIPSIVTLAPAIGCSNARHDHAADGVDAGQVVGTATLSVTSSSSSPQIASQSVSWDGRRPRRRSRPRWPRRSRATTSSSPQLPPSSSSQDQASEPPSLSPSSSQARASPSSSAWVSSSPQSQSSSLSSSPWRSSSSRPQSSPPSAACSTGSAVSSLASSSQLQSTRLHRRGLPRPGRLRRPSSSRRRRPRRRCSAGSTISSSWASRRVSSVRSPSWASSLSQSQSSALSSARSSSMTLSMRQVRLTCRRLRSLRSPSSASVSRSSSSASPSSEDALGRRLFVWGLLAGRGLLFSRAAVDDRRVVRRRRPKARARRAPPRCRRARRWRARWPRRQERSERAWRGDLRGQRRR